MEGESQNQRLTGRSLLRRRKSALDCSVAEEEEEEEEGEGGGGGGGGGGGEASIFRE